jgi:hypothetical protein
MILPTITSLTRKSKRTKECIMCARRSDSRAYVRYMHSTCTQSRQVTRPPTRVSDTTNKSRAPVPTFRFRRTYPREPHACVEWSPPADACVSSPATWACVRLDFSCFYKRLARETSTWPMMHMCTFRMICSRNACRLCSFTCLAHVHGFLVT